MFEAFFLKSALWVHHRNRQIKNRTSDEEVIKKRRLKIKGENEKEMKNENDDDDEVKRNGRKCMLILKWKISTLVL